MENPNYYAIIPAKVRYDKELKPMAKLLYGEISALCNKSGYCYATNKYFAELYGLTTVTISNLISDLVSRGYLASEIVYKEGTKEIDNRYLKIIEEGIKENFDTPIKENFKENNTSINNIKENITKESKRFKAPTHEEVEKYIADNNLNVNANDFIDYFEAPTWIDSKGNKVKSWKGKLRTWSSFHKQENNKVNKSRDEIQLQQIYERLRC